ncbi:MAG: DUF3592 domain-containing protein [Gammaproteobacteria bacterium]|nr:DUF3592 domain-containing protein [Gammaproteobacteria bacterium]
MTQPASSGAAAPQVRLLSRRRRRAGGRWGLVLFALPFLIGCVFVSKIALVPMLVDAHRMQSWVQGEARLSSAGVDVRRSDDSTTYQARATYTYEYEGLTYSGDRVAVGGGADNIGDFQQKLGQELRRAYESGRPVPVWIDPDDPREAVLNRDLRFELLALLGALALISGGVALGLLWFALRKRPTPAVGAPDKPWLEVPEWASPEVRSSARRNVYAAWFFAAFWNVIAIPVGFMTTLEFLDGNRPAIFGLLFPLAGLVLIAWALKATANWRRFGATVLAMDPYPGAIGGQVGGTIDLRLPYDPRLAFNTTLSCLYSYVSGSGKNRRRSERVVWQSEGIAHAQSHMRGTRLEVLFDVDQGLPPSDVKDQRDYHLWRLSLAADMPGVDFDRSFEIPVFPTGEQAKALRSGLSTEHPLAAEVRGRAIERVLDMKRVAGGAEIFCPAFTAPGAKLAGLAIGIVLLAAALLTGGTDMPRVLRFLLGALGGAVTVASLYNLVLSLRVRIDSSQVEVRKRLLGLPAGNATIPRRDAKSLVLKQSYSSRSGNRHRIYYKLQLLTRDERRITIAHNLVGRETAAQALEALSEMTSIPVASGEAAA